jgi:hypothetical protein
MSLEPPLNFNSGRGNSPAVVLQSHTVETAAQEIAALVLVSAPLRLGLFEDLLSDRQKNQIVRRVYNLMGHDVGPLCPRCAFTTTSQSAPS